MKDKIREFFRKLNNSYVLVAICMMLILLIALGALVNLVAQPFCKNMTYSLRVTEKTEYKTYTSTVDLLLLENGRYSLTIKEHWTKETLTTFGDYGYGRVRDSENNKRFNNVIWFDNHDYNPFDSSVYVLKSPFKLEYEGYEFTNVGAIVMLVIHCNVIAATSAIATILLIKRKKGKIVFSDRLGIFRKFI